MLTTLLRWPMLVLGFAGVVSFRRRCSAIWAHYFNSGWMCTEEPRSSSAAAARPSLRRRPRLQPLDLLPRRRELYLSAERHHRRCHSRSYDLLHYRWQHPDCELDQVHDADLGFLYGNTDRHR